MNILISLALLVTTTSCFDLASNPFFKKLKEECQKENSKCIPRCIGEKSGIITKTGTIDPAMVDSQLPKMMPVDEMSAQQVDKVLTCIKRTKQITTCQDVHRLILTCWISSEAKLNPRYHVDKRECLKEAGIEDLKSSENEMGKLNCYLRCMSVKNNFIMKNGTVDHKTIEAKMNRLIPGQETEELVDFLECMRKFDQIKTCDDMDQVMKCKNSKNL